jgi:hypothetical protein
MDEDSSSWMTPETQKAVWWLAQLWPFVIVSLAVYAGGEGAKRVAKIFVPNSTPDEKQPRWYKLWYATIRWHPILVGGLAGLIPGIPAPSWVPDIVTGRVFWYALAGAMSGYMYAAFKDVPAIIRSLAKSKLGVELPERPSSSNPPGDSQP